MTRCAPPRKGFQLQAPCSTNRSPRADDWSAAQYARAFGRRHGLLRALQTILERAHDAGVELVKNLLERHWAPWRSRLVGLGPPAQQPSHLGRQGPAVAWHIPQRIPRDAARSPEPVKRRCVEVADSVRPGCANNSVRLFSRDLDPVCPPSVPVPSPRTVTLSDVRPEGVSRSPPYRRLHYIAAGYYVSTAGIGRVQRAVQSRIDCEITRA